MSGCFFRDYLHAQQTINRRSTGTTDDLMTQWHTVLVEALAIVNLLLMMVSCPQTKDMLLREELEKVLKSHSEQLNLCFTIDRPPQGKTIVFHDKKKIKVQGCHGLIPLYHSCWTAKKNIFTMLCHHIITPFVGTDWLTARQWPKNPQRCTCSNPFELVCYWCQLNEWKPFPLQSYPDIAMI